MHKPFILAVDTEQQIAGALERDLPKRYGADYTVVVEHSPLAALERLRAFRQAGAEASMIIVGLWMAEMPGLQLLDHAHALFPDAKRLLLIAYVDPTVDGVAATATALDQFDAYVSKPWVTPEEWLYPAIGDLLSEWAKDHLPCFDAVRVVGSQWSPDTHLMRDLLERNPVPYGFYPDDSAEVQRLLADFHLDAERLPVAILYDGRALVRPRPAELAAALGARLRPRRRLYDVAVIGAGPAGLHLHRARSARPRRQASAWMVAHPPAVLPRDEPARGLRGRRRAQRLDEARSLGGRGGRDGDRPCSPVSQHMRRVQSTPTAI
jgi:thioredoxin reductase (NADPH)